MGACFVLWLIGTIGMIVSGAGPRTVGPQGTEDAVALLLANAFVVYALLAAVYSFFFGLWTRYGLGVGCLLGLVFFFCGGSLIHGLPDQAVLAQAKVYLAQQ